MRKNTLKTLGITVLTVAMLAVTGCGNKETADVQPTEVVEAVVETEAVEETEVAPEATEEVVAESTETVETEEVEETEMVEKTETAEVEPAFTVKDMSATKFAKQAVKVRKGPSTDYEQLGSLSQNQQVTVTGQADTGWYRIEYKGEVGYVSGSFLVNKKVAVAAPTAPAQTPDTNTTQNQTQNQTWVDSNAGNAWTGGTAATPSTPAVTPSAPAVTPSAPVTPPVDNSNSLGTIGGLGTGSGPVTDGNGSNETTWE